MSYISAIIQGLIQGLTEFLPVSSSGHLSLFQYFTGQSSESSVLFSILLHFGTLAAVTVAFWPKIWELLIEVFTLIRDLITGKLKQTPPTPNRRMLYLLFLSCLPLLVVPVFQPQITSLSADNSILAEGIGFLITSILLFWADRLPQGHKTANNQPPASAVVIGIAQVCATVPGISRSGSTICSGLLMGLERSYAVAYSFILGMPTILAAGLLSLGELNENATMLNTFGWSPALIGMIAGAISGFFAIKLVNYLAATNRFKIFACYTLFLGLSVTTIAIVEMVSDHAVQSIILSLLS